MLAKCFFFFFQDQGEWLVLTLHVEHAGNVGTLSLSEQPGVKGLIVALKDLGGGRLIHWKIVHGESNSHDGWSGMY